MSASRVISFVVLAGLAGCGRGTRAPDGAVSDAVGNPDAMGFPAPPALGAQIDRMGRPAISTALVAVLASAGPAKTAQKDAYNHAADPAAWRTTMLQTNVTVERELRGNLAVLDAIDRGLTTPMAGCGSALMYVGPPGASTYQGAADMFADDQLYVDTARQSCSVYLALEFEHASGGTVPHSTCGGRMLGHDVIDATYSVLVSGLGDYDPRRGDLVPKIRDGATVHPDITDTFPFLGPPH
jgi:hypothetical protein